MELDIVLLGDCRERLKELDDDSVDLVIVDIPYNKKKGFPNDNLPEEEYRKFVVECIKAVFKKMKYHSSIYMFIDQEGAYIIHPIFARWFFYRDTIIWQFEGFYNGFHDKYVNRHECILYGTKSVHEYTFNEMKERPSASLIKRWGPYADEDGNVPFDKLTPSMQKRQSREAYNRNPINVQRGLYQGNVMTCNRARYKQHPTEKPEPLVKKLVQVSSNRGDTVLDFCCGSGTTLVVAKKTGRHFIGIEILPEYYQTAIDRLNSIKVQKALF